MVGWNVPQNSLRSQFWCMKTTHHRLCLKWVVMFVYLQQEERPRVSSELREEGLGSAGDGRQHEWRWRLRGKACGDFPRDAVIFWSPLTSHKGKQDFKCTATVVTPCGCNTAYTWDRCCMDGETALLQLVEEKVQQLVGLKFLLSKLYFLNHSCALSLLPSLPCYAMLCYLALGLCISWY